MLSQKGRLAVFARRPEKITLPNMMKSIRTLLVTQTVLTLGGLAFANTNSLVTFDELTQTASGLAVPANYAGLNWNNFFYIDGVNYAGNPSGFQAGVVSSNNVAYNVSTNPASIVGGLFDLNSAYLTAAWNDNLEVEAKGYIGGVLSYDQTYTLSATARTLIQFNYLGVDQVDFVASGGSHHAGYNGTGTNFVMDNVDLTLYIPSSPIGQVQNGGFESGFTNWIRSGTLDSTDVVTDPEYVHSGTYGAQFGPGGSLGFISQTLLTTPGAPYVLSFWLDSPDGATPNEFLVSWNGATLFDQTNLPALGTNPPANGWTNLQFSVTATGTTAIIQFGFQDDPTFLGLDDISLAPPVSVQFTASPTNGTVPLTVQFGSPSVDSGGQALTNWNWDFGDGSSSTAQNPSHLYGRPATFSPSLIATNGSGVKDYGGGPSIVVTLPTIQFTASAARGPVPLSVQFTSPNVDSAGNAITNRDWDFGDGSPHSALQNPSHIYATNGTFANGLLVTSANVGPRIRAGGPAPITTWIPSGKAGELVQNGGFETAFTGWTQSGNDGATLLSTNALYVHSGTNGAQLGPFGSLGFISQTLATTPGASYVLSFWLDSPTNGLTPNEFLVSWNGATLFGQINLPAIGWTNLQFSVTATGTTAVLQFGFRDDPSYFGLDDISVAPPVSVQFSASPTNGTVPLTVQFSSPSVDSGGQALTKWNWDFGDGSSSTAQNPSHSYGRPATFSPSLVATNSSGMTDYGSGPSIVVSLPTVQFTASAARGPVPLSVQFTSPSVDSAGNVITNWDWDFGDGSPPSALQNPSHIYVTNGIFTNGLLVMCANVGPPIRADGPSPITTWFPSGGKVGELVQNGGFETAFSGWILSGNEASTLLATNLLYVHSGTNGAKLGPSGSLGFISQTLTTTPGASYVLSFWLDSPDGQPTNEFLVSWNGATLFDQTNLPAIGWTNLQFSVTATGTTGVIQFGFRDDPAFLGLDDISVAPPVSLQFSASPTNGTAPLTVQFTSPGVDNEGHTLTSWNWNFGDGATNSAPNPAHTYTGVGAFFPFLIATNDNGVADIANGPAIVVRQLLPVRLTDPRVTGSDFSFSFVTVSNNSYTVWRKADLTSATWLDYSNFIADGYVKQITAAATNAAQFFRVSQP